MLSQTDSKLGKIESKQREIVKTTAAFEGSNRCRRFVAINAICHQSNNAPGNMILEELKSN